MRLENIWRSGTLSGTCHKWVHYFEIYERHLEKFVNTPATYLEIGVQNGGSLRLMKEYLGEQARIVGLDIVLTKKAQETGFPIYVGKQENVEFLNQVVDKEKKFDIIIDDGSHNADHQKITFNTLFPILNNGGIYIIEDLHCSQYWGEPYLNKDKTTFLDYAKMLADQLSLWHKEVKDFHYRYNLPIDQRPVINSDIPDFPTKQIFGISYYDSIIVIEKRSIPEPTHHIK